MDFELESEEDSTCEADLYLDFSVSGEFDPEEFSHDMGIQPDRLAKKGQSNPDLNLPMRSSWVLTEGPIPRAQFAKINDLIGRISDRLAHREDLLRRLAHMRCLDVGLIVRIKPHSGNKDVDIGVVLGDRSVKFLNKMRASVAFIVLSG
jgi:hypothetical protein